MRCLQLIEVLRWGSVYVHLLLPPLSSVWQHHLYPPIWVLTAVQPGCYWQHQVYQSTLLLPSLEFQLGCCWLLYICQSTLLLLLMMKQARCRPHQIYQQILYFVLRVPMPAI
mmetsp:Transcript_82424/g.229687  ORF Transcript_82424/g.229687 Transcript_82424/m.229687 type:complete len:112 (-) Transcript_82424:1101-1436(-)